MRALTDRQQSILDFVRHEIDEKGLPPTRAEIAKAFGFASANAAEAHLRALVQKGAMTIEPGSSRGIRLTEEKGLPIIGNVAAGSPILAQEHIDAHRQIKPSLFTPCADYLLRVRGNSMINAGIFEGDLLAIHKTSEAQNGQIIVARVDDDVTVKRFFRRTSHVIELIAENPEYAPIVVTPGQATFAIEGLAVGLIRDAIF